MKLKTIKKKPSWYEVKLSIPGEGKCSTIENNNNKKVHYLLLAKKSSRHKRHCEYISWLV